MRTFKNILFSVSVLLNLAFLFYGFHFVWHTKYRAELAHGIDLPETTVVRECTGTRFDVEGHTRSEFQIHAIQLSELLSELEIRHETIDTVDGNLVHYLTCTPPIGDMLTVRYKIYSGHCYVTMDTDWN